MIELRNFKNKTPKVGIHMQYPLPTVLPDFNKATILVVGDMMLDRYWFGDTGRVSPEAPVPIVKINSTDNRPGGAGNVALNIAALGGKVKILGVAGLDEAAATLEQQLAAANVDCHLYKSASLSTIIKLRVISRHQQLLRMDFEDKIEPVHQDVLLQQFKQQLVGVDLVILSDYGKGTLSDPQAFIQAARAVNIPVLVDPKSTDFTIYRGASIITPNFKEFEAVVGRCQHEDDILTKGRALLTQFDIQTLLVTRGEDGMTLIQKDGHTHLPAYAREVFDVTGAGDTVIGTLGAAAAAGAELVTATALANLAASLAVGKLGAATVSAPELFAALTGKTNFATGIVNEAQLLQGIKEARTQGKTVVFTNGCFDILHAGHVTYLQMAKQLGDYLVVAVNADESIRRLKGENRPINNLEQRMTVLAGLGVVDWVVPFADDTPERLLRLLQPNLLVKGGDYTIDQVVGADIVRSYGGEVRLMHHNITTTSSSIIEHLNHKTEGAKEANG